MFHVTVYNKKIREAIVLLSTYWYTKHNRDASISAEYRHNILLVAESWGALIGLDLMSPLILLPLIVNNLEDVATWGFMPDSYERQNFNRKRLLERLHVYCIVQA